MRLALFGLAGLLAIIAIAFIVGMLLPQGHVARSSVHLSRSADSVWQVVRSMGAYATWWPNVKSMERVADPNGREVWRQVDRRNSQMPMVVIEEDPPRRLVTKIIDDGLPFGGTWTYEIAPDGEGTRVTIIERGEVYNAFFRVISRVFMGHHGTMDSYLVALGQHFGETVVPEHQ